MARDDAAGNPNGSMHNIAGICNRERNVAGLMPHPERAVESALDSADGLVIFAPWSNARDVARPRLELRRGGFISQQHGLS